MKAKEIVLREYPDAYAYEYTYSVDDSYLDCFQIHTVTSNSVTQVLPQGSNEYKFLGIGKTEEEAWKDAARLCNQP